MSDDVRLSPLEIARFLAAKAIAEATAFLDGRSNAVVLKDQADQLCSELLVVSSDPACTRLADPTRLLVVVMMRTAGATGARADRWRSIMHAFVDLVRMESLELRRRDGLQS